MPQAVNPDAVFLFRYADADALAEHIAPFMDPMSLELFAQKRRVIQNHLDTAALNGKGALERNHLGTVETIDNTDDRIHATFATHHYVMDRGLGTQTAIEKQRVVLPLSPPLDRDDTRLRIISAITDCRTAVLDHAQGDLQLDFVTLPQIGEHYVTVGTTVGTNYCAHVRNARSVEARHAAATGTGHISRKSLRLFIDNALAAGVIAPMHDMPVALAKKIPPLPCYQ